MKLLEKGNIFAVNGFLADFFAPKPVPIQKLD